jgi:hypothetical protein
MLVIESAEVVSCFPAQARRGDWRAQTEEDETLLDEHEAGEQFTYEV